MRKTPVGVICCVGSKFTLQLSSLVNKQKMCTCHIHSNTPQIFIEVIICEDIMPCPSQLPSPGMVGMLSNSNDKAISISNQNYLVFNLNHKLKILGMCGNNISLIIMFMIKNVNFD